MSANRQRARERAAQELRRQAERDARRRRAGIAAAGLLALAVLGALVLTLTRDGGGTVATPTLPADLTTPAGLSAGAIVTGTPEAPVTVTVFEDLQCPACKAFEAASGATLDELAQAGTIRLERRPVAILDRASTTDYSSRAMNAVGCVLDSDAEAAEPYLKTLYDRQPDEGGPGLPDSELVELAAASGADGIGDCVGSRSFGSWVSASTEASTEAGVTGTPTVLVDNQVLQDRSPEGLRAAVQAAQAVG